MKKAKGIKNHSTHVPPRRKQGDFGGIKVAVRFRPLTDTERKRGETSVWGVDEANNVGVIYKGNFSPKYHYDTVFQQDKDNQFVYEAIASEIVSKAMGGINGTIFAYGVTSSGKTHTMFGSKGEMGIIQRAIKHVFELIEQSPGNEYLLRLSMLEIYNEKLNDLLDPTQTNLKIMEDKTKSVHVESLTDVLLESVEQALTLIETGNANRTMNVVSSKNETRHSHTLCRISIEVNGKTVSYLNLVDVASSDSARDASLGNKTAHSFNNKSLLTLRTVIYRLSDSKRSNTHIPFRDGKLTRLLWSQLTGTGDRAVMICCISPASSQKTETHNTLKFASQAERIESKDEEEVMRQESLVDYYQREIAKLKTRLKEMSEKTAAASEPAYEAPDSRLQEELTNMRERLEEELYARMQREDDRLALNRRIDRLTRLILHSTRAQTDYEIPVYELRRSQSCNSALKAHPIFKNRVQWRLPGELEQDYDSANDELREELIMLRKAMANSKKELELKNRDTEELQRVQIELQQMQKKLQEYESGRFLNEKLLLRNDGFLRRYSQSPSAYTSTTDSKLSDIELRLECPHRVDEKPPCHLLNFVSEGDGPLESFCYSPTALELTTDFMFYATPFCLENPSMEDRPPRPPPHSASGGSSDQQTSSAETHAKVERLASEVSQAFEQLAVKERQIETQRIEMMTYKNETDGIRKKFKNLAAENERLKIRIHLMKEDNTVIEQSNFEDYAQRGFLSDMNTSFPEDPNPPPSSSNRRSFCSEMNNSFNSGEIDQDCDSESQGLREELIEVRKAMADRERELELKNRETDELRKKLALYEGANPSTARSIASEDDGTLEYLLLEADRGHLEDSLTVMKKEKRRLTDQLLRVKIDLKRTQKKLQEYESGSCSTERQPLRESGPSGSYPQSPTASVSTIDSKLSASPFSLGRPSMEDRPPRPPPHSLSGGSSDQPMSSAEMHAKVERLASEVSQAFEQLAAKERQIETQRSEIVTFKDEAVAIREQLRNLASENERLKMRIHTMTSEQDRMQGFLLDSIPSKDLDNLSTNIKDASSRVERAAFSRRLSFNHSLSTEELDRDSTKDIYVLKGLESDD